MKTKKLAYVAKTRKGRTTIYAGTIEELRTNVFDYTLKCGNSWNKKISREPKTVASLVSNLNKSVSETQGGCYQDYYEVSSKEQYDVQEAAKAPKQEVESSKVNNEQEVESSKVNNEQKVKQSNKSRKVGDIHSNGKWIWTEYSEGKFDWRTIKNSVR